MIEFIPVLLGSTFALSVIAGSWWLYERVNRRTFLENERLRLTWRPLAERNQLEFVPGVYQRVKLQGAYVSGEYRGYPLKLDSFYRSEADDKTYIYTRIVVSVEAGNYEAAAWLDELTDRVTVQDVTQYLNSSKMTSTRWPTKTEKNGAEIYYEQRGLETDVSLLQAMFDGLVEQAKTHAGVLGLGSEAVPILQQIGEDTQDSDFKNTVTQLLRGIALQTTAGLASEADVLICLDCVTRFTIHEVKLSWLEKISYVGCRTCGQSRRYHLGQVFAVLNDQLDEETYVQQEILHVNWSRRRSLFDFDAVAIASATDEAVERFAVQVGNDTDPIRRPRYAHMRCLISDQSGISNNSLRILQNTFDNVEIV